jgi:hypothetical protein
LVLNTNQGRDEVDARHVVDVVNLHVTLDALVPAALDARLEDVGVVVVLHRLGAQVDAQMFQLTRLHKKK